MNFDEIDPTSEYSHEIFCSYLDSKYVYPITDSVYKTRSNLDICSIREVFKRCCLLFSEQEMNLIIEFEKNDIKCHPILVEEVMNFLAEKALLSEK